MSNPVLMSVQQSWCNKTCSGEMVQPKKRLQIFFSKFFECNQLGFESCLGSMTIKQTYHSYQQQFLDILTKTNNSYIYPVRTAPLVARQTGTGNVPGSNLAVSKLNFQLEKGCRRDSKQYTIKQGCIASNSIKQAQKVSLDKKYPYYTLSYGPQVPILRVALIHNLYEQGVLITLLRQLHFPHATCPGRLEVMY